MLRFPIDCVVLWVDGNDPEWLKEKTRYTTGKENAHNAGASRFRDWGLMKYWFRAIDTYAPWIRKVHFVTWGHLPDFLDPDSPKLHIVNHRDYLPEEILPTFSSHTLELNMHRIPDLKEHFIYCNDDMFLTRPVSPEDFFAPDGRPKLNYQEMPLRFKGVATPIQRILSADVGLINKHFRKSDIDMSTFARQYMGKGYTAKNSIRNLAAKTLYPEYYVGFKLSHGLGTFCRSSFTEIWDAEPELMQNISRKRFRDSEDINQWAVLFWQMISGNFVQAADPDAYYNADSRTVDEICRVIESRSMRSICINDPDNSKDYESVAEKIKKSFDKVLPNRSSFEKEKK